MLLSLCLLGVFGLIFYALYRKKYVRVKGSVASFFVEFEAGDERRDPERAGREDKLRS
jgi:hypothetical protein